MISNILCLNFSWEWNTIQYAHHNTHSKWRNVWFPLQWRHNGRDSVSNHQPHDCLLNRLFKRRSKKTSKLRVTGLCAGNSPGTGEFPAQMASNAENVSIWWRHHDQYFNAQAHELLFSELSWIGGIVSTLTLIDAAINHWFTVAPV